MSECFPAAPGRFNLFVLLLCVTLFFFWGGGEGGEGGGRGGGVGSFSRMGCISILKTDLFHIGLEGLCCWQPSRA